MPQTEPWTIERLLLWTTDYLKKQGAESPRLDAEILLAKARDCQRIDLYTAFTQEVDEAVRSAFRELVRRRAEGTPVAYLVGHKEFFSLSFQVTPAVLIPRPETESLVLELLDLLKEKNLEDRPALVADVGVGSGAISVAVAKHGPPCQITAIDISREALKVAQTNVENNQVDKFVSLVESDLLESIPTTEKFDFIVSNPPYVKESELEEISPEVKDFEPHLALLGGKSGDEVIARLIPQAAQYLIPGGWLLMEISPMIEASVRSLIDAESDFESPIVSKDLSGLVRIIKARRLS